MSKVYFDQEQHRYFTDEEMTNEIWSVSRLLEHFGYSNFDKIKQMGREHVLEAAAYYGSQVHETLAFYDENVLGDYDEHLIGDLESWKQYLYNYKPNFLMIEEMLASKVWQFAGTPDRVTEDSIIDIKTGSPTKAHQLQLALYQILVEENTPLKIKNRYTVLIKPEGYKLINHNDKNDLVIARAMLTIYKDLKKKGLIEC